LTSKAEPVRPKHFAAIPGPHKALRWGIKQSFRDYVLALNDGSENLSSQVTRDERGNFSFEADPNGTSKATNDEPMKFQGSVVLSGYRGMLLVRVRDPWIEVTNSGMQLTVMHPAYREKTTERLALAELVEVGTREVEGSYYSTLGSRLLAPGVRTFDDVYKVGTELDDLTVVFHSRRG
jgi:hypothetical protein